MPKLSIITVNLNNKKGLEKTIKSVVSQTFTNYEYIIIDGGSTDGSKEIIEKYSDKITYWVSEQDKGIYNGMNKGIKVAKGEYCLFLNSGDWFVEKNVLYNAFKFRFEEDIVYGNLFVNEEWIKICPNKLTLNFFLKDSLPHPASFIKTELFFKYGFYDENLKIVSDWKFFLEMIINKNCSYKHIELLIANFNLDGISSLQNNRLKKERLIVMQENIKKIYDDYIYLDKKLQKYKDSKMLKFVIQLQNSKIYTSIIKLFR